MTRSIRDLICTRRTIHEFRPGSAPPVETIRAAIECAVRAPNHYLTQPWRFYILGPETVERICILNSDLVREKQGDKAAEMKLRRWRAIPGWLLLTNNLAGDEVRRRENFAACCCAAQNLMLYLWEQGIGVKWNTGAVIRDQRFFEITRVDPSAEQGVGIFWYGMPVEIPDTARSPVEKYIVALP